MRPGKNKSGKVFSMYLKWAANYTKEYITLCDTKVIEKEPGVFGTNIILVRDILNYKVIDGYFLREIKRFLDNQTVIIPKSKYLIYLVKDLLNGARLCVDELSDIDFSDIHSHLKFILVVIKNKKNRPWKDEEVQNVKKEIKDNFNAQCEEISFRRMLNKATREKPSNLYLKVNVFNPK